MRQVLYIVITIAIICICMQMAWGVPKLERNLLPETQIELYYSPPFQHDVGETYQQLYALYPKAHQYTHTVVWAKGYPSLLIVGNIAYDGDTIVLTPRYKMDMMVGPSTPVSTKFLGSPTDEFYLPKKCVKENDSVLLMHKDLSTFLSNEEWEELSQAAENGDSTSLKLFQGMYGIATERIYRIPDFFGHWPWFWYFGEKPENPHPDSQKQNALE